jgi:hypothetical protein
MRLKYLTKIAILPAVFFAGIIYFLFNPENGIYFPQCFFHRFTGLDCPGCGSQRAIHYLLHLQLKEAFFSNPLLVLAIPYVAVYLYFEYFGGKERFPKVYKILFGKTAVITILIVIILFWIGRNIASH